MEAVFSSHRKVFLNEFSIPASGNSICLVETVFFYIEIFFLLVETEKSNFWKTPLFLLVETNFLANGNRFFLPFSDTPTTTSFIFLCSGNVFLN